MVTISATEARATLPELLDRVGAGEEVTITRHGQPVAVVIRPDALRARRAVQALAGAANIADLLEAGRAIPLSAAGLTTARAEELVADVRASRKRR